MAWSCYNLCQLERVNTYINLTICVAVYHKPLRFHPTKIMPSVIMQCLSNVIKKMCLQNNTISLFRNGWPSQLWYPRSVRQFFLFIYISLYSLLYFLMWCFAEATNRTKSFSGEVCLLLTLNSDRRRDKGETQLCGVREKFNLQDKRAVNAEVKSQEANATRIDGRALAHLTMAKTILCLESTTISYKTRSHN